MERVEENLDNYRRRAEPARTHAPAEVETSSLSIRIPSDVDDNLPYPKIGAMVVPLVGVVVVPLVGVVLLFAKGKALTPALCSDRKTPVTEALPCRYPGSSS